MNFYKHKKDISLFKRLKTALVEKDVEDVYREVLRIAFPDAEINSPFKSDGLLKSKAHNLIALLEFKFDYNFKERNDIATVLTQALFYLKKFEQNGELLPTILFIGDINECFCMHTNVLLKYLSFDIDWTVAPSQSHKYNHDLTVALFEDDEILPYVFDVDVKFIFSDVVNKMLDLNDGIVHLVRVTEKNINAIFDYFCKNVIKKQKDYSANELVGMFLQLIINPVDNYLHPVKANTLVMATREVKVDTKKFLSFFSHFEKDYKPSEKARLTEIADRLLEDETRRREGAFFTPTAWVDEAHKMLDEQLGDDWREEYVVWDCACGTGNLTRDYRFKELYCSTLIEDEIELMKQGGISNEADRFTYDFLNTMELPNGIKQAIEDGRKVLFLINPPYGTAKSMSTEEGNSKAGIAETMINKMMKTDKIGGASQNLYAQFLYRIGKIREQNNNITIGLFSPTLFLTGGSYKNFRKFFLDRFRILYGMVFQASHFADVSAQWGIMFSIWASGLQENKTFDIDVKNDLIDLE